MRKSEITKKPQNFVGKNTPMVSIQEMEDENEEKNFWEAIINVKKQNYPKALNNIIKNRKNIY